MKGEFESNPLKTILIICVGFTVIGVLADKSWALYVAIGVGGAGSLIPWIAEKVEWFWFGIAKVLGFIVPNILLSLVFYIVLFPMSALNKIFKKTDALKLKDKYDSMYVDVEEEFTKEGFERPF